MQVYSVNTPHVAQICCVGRLKTTTVVSITDNTADTPALPSPDCVNATHERNDQQTNYSKAVAIAAAAAEAATQCTHHITPALDLLTFTDT
jgi:hypothetical protein